MTADEITEMRGGNNIMRFIEEDTKSFMQDNIQNVAHNNSTFGSNVPSEFTWVQPGRITEVKGQ